MSAFHARILASDTLFFDGDCEFMVVPCTDGAMGILSHHSNMIAAVVPGELRFQPVGGPLRTAAVSAGLVKVEAGEVMLLVSTAERPEDIDLKRAQEAKERAKEQLRQKQSIEDIDVNRARRAEDAAKEALLQKKSMQEHRNAEAQLARAISRLRTKEHWNSGR